MEDRELLERAAKAAGLNLTGGHGEAGGQLFLFYRDRNGFVFSWGPLHGDDDAFRLMSKLKIDIHYEWNGSQLGDIVETMPPEGDDGSRLCLYEKTDEDVAAATRRAIVRAAAAMVE